MHSLDRREINDLELWNVCYQAQRGCFMVVIYGIHCSEELHACMHLCQQRGCFQKNSLEKLASPSPPWLCAEGHEVQKSPEQ